MSSTTKKSESTLSTGVSRLVRSLSKNPTKTTDVSPSPNRTPSATANETAVKSTDVHRIPKQKLTAFELFTQLGKKKDQKPEFPPRAWFDGQAEPSVTAVAETVPLPPTPATDDGKEMTGDTSKEVIVQDDVSKETIVDEVERPPEPTSLARKIQDLISALPVLSAYSSSSSLSSAKPTIQSPPADTAPADIALADDTNGPPMPPPAPITDSKLISLLSSATIMNGSLSKGRQSVWSVLDRLRSPTAKGAVDGPNATGHAEKDDDDDDDDNSSVMMYAPVQPDASSEVEIARSEICSVDEEGEVISERPGEDMNKPEVSQKAEDKAGREQSSGKGKGKATEESKKVKEVRVWVPSIEKISLQATWWGYRLYLPPPVLDILNNKQLEAAKRAAMITTALKWLLDRIPVKLFPPQFRPILMVLKRLAPYLGYIGVFIAWSWGAIKAFDKGNGVILTATWLLPVALIPSTWDDDLVQPPPPPPKDANKTSSLKEDNKSVKAGDKEPVKDYRKIVKD